MLFKKMNLLRPLTVLALAVYVFATPAPASAAKAGGGKCGVCGPQNVPCGGSQQLMNSLCTSACGVGNAYGCSHNDQDCAPLFYDGWWCGGEA
jgi:hypothetical protein